MSGFDFKEYQKWVKNLGIADSEFEIWLKQFLLEQAQRVVREAKQRTPVDTGALINSYAIGGQEIALEYYQDENGKDKFKLDTKNSEKESIANVGDNEVTIFNGQEYASYVEYGHHSYQGRYMLTIAVDDIYKAMPTRFDRQFKQWLKSKGVGS